MAQMQAIEGADAHYAAIRAQWPAVEVAEEFGHSGPGRRAQGTDGQSSINSAV
jgi:hypothetical protein